jgi:hypothetical protein
MHIIISIPYIIVNRKQVNIIMNDTVYSVKIEDNSMTCCCIGELTHKLFSAGRKTVMVIKG